VNAKTYWTAFEDIIEVDLMERLLQKVGILIMMAWLLKYRIVFCGDDNLRMHYDKLSENEHNMADEVRYFDYNNSFNYCIDKHIHRI